MMQTNVLAMLTLIVACLLSVHCSHVDGDEPRYWTTSEGRRSDVRLSVVNHDARTLTLKRESDDKTVRLPIASLSVADRQYVRALNATPEVSTAMHAAPRTGVDSGANWPQYRGPNGQGISKETNLPTQWSESDNMLWTAEIPGRGAASAIVWGNRVFTVCYSGYGLDPQSPGNVADLTFHLLCYHRDSGRLLWDKSVKNRGDVRSFDGWVAKMGYASHTPVTDGEVVYCFFGTHGIEAFDFDGNRLWQHGPLPLNDAKYGSGASPIISGNAVIVNANNEGRQLIALDRRTGRELWRRENLPGGAYMTPAEITVRGTTGILVNNSRGLFAYDNRSGRDLWHVAMGSPYVISQTLIAGETVYASSDADSAKTYALRPDGNGDLTSNIVWTSRRESMIASPVLVDGHLFVEKDGILCCLRERDGTEVFRERLKNVGARSFSSMVVADGNIYYTNPEGKTAVIRASPPLKVVRVNEISGDDSQFTGTIAISGGKLFLRSQKRLYCIGKK